jgi:hypothetical protein
VSTLEPSCFSDYTSAAEVAPYFATVVGLFKQLDLYSALAAAGVRSYLLPADHIAELLCVDHRSRRRATRPMPWRTCKPRSSPQQATRQTSSASAACCPACSSTSTRRVRSRMACSCRERGCRLWLSSRRGRAVTDVNMRAQADAQVELPSAGQLAAEDGLRFNAAILLLAVSLSQGLSFWSL